MNLENAPLYFTIGLAIILILGSLIIWRSSLPENDKLTSLVVIMSLLALVTIVNEYKRPQIIDKQAIPKTTPIIRNITSYDKVFYTRHPKNASNFSFPYIDEPRELVTNSLNNWNPLESHVKVLAFLYSEDGSGTSAAIEDYTNDLKSRKFPVIHLNLEHPSYTVFNFVGALKMENIDDVKDTITKLNSIGSKPVFFIENIQNAVMTDSVLTNEFTCAFCDYLVSLYDDYQISVILVSNDTRIRNFLQAGKKEPYELL